MFKKYVYGRSRFKLILSLLFLAGLLLSQIPSASPAQASMRLARPGTCWARVNADSEWFKLPGSISDVDCIRVVSVYNRARTFSAGYHKPHTPDSLLPALGYFGVKDQKLWIYRNGNIYPCGTVKSPCRWW